MASKLACRISVHSGKSIPLSIKCIVAEHCGNTKEEDNQQPLESEGSEMTSSVHIIIGFAGLRTILHFTILLNKSLYTSGIFCRPSFFNFRSTFCLDSRLIKVLLSPSQLLTLEEMEENNLQRYILSVESWFGIGVNATSSEMQDSFPLPQFCGRILTHYGTFPYHLVHKTNSIDS